MYLADFCNKRWSKEKINSLHKHVQWGPYSWRVNKKKINVNNNFLLKIFINVY